MRSILILAGLASLWAAPNQAVNWDAAKDGSPKTYAAPGLTLTLAAAHPQGDQGGQAEPPVPVLTAVSPRFGRGSLRGQPGFATAAAQFTVVRLDPKADGPAVVLTSYSGGAHCCTEVVILDPVGGRWRQVDGGDWNGGPALPPTDLDGDGTPDFLLDDENFLYAFACYACGSAPPKIFDVIGGAWTDVSPSPRFARVFEKDAAQMKSGCADAGGQNGLCAVYVADEARLGRFAPAWTYMLAHYKQADDWVLPTGCDVARSPDRSCPKGHEIKYKTYPEALRNFLLETGYITPAQASAAPASAPH